MCGCHNLSGRRKVVGFAAWPKTAVMGQRFLATMGGRFRLILFAVHVGFEIGKAESADQGADAKIADDPYQH